MGRIGMPELIIIALVIMILFGARKLPEFARYFSQALKEFKKSTKESSDDSQQQIANDKGDDTKV